jgi:tryptophan synthase alpha chain
VTALLDHLEKARSQDRKLLVPYLTAGIPEPDAFPEALGSIAAHADAVEIGIPYSDPLMDGPVIAGASQRAISAGVRPLDAIDLAGNAQVTAPTVAMTYYNPIHRAGEQTFCERLAAARILGLIVPDLPLEESGSLRSAASDAGLAWIPLVTPTTARDRVADVVATATGFVYAVSTLGVTGTREELSKRAAEVSKACRAATDLPVLVGIGISNGEQAKAAAAGCDGVVIGSAVVRLVLEQGAEAAEAWLKDVRAALDESDSEGEAN